MKKYSVSIMLLLFAFLLSSNALAQAKRSQSFPVGKSSTFEIGVSGGDIKINSWEKNEIKVEINGLDQDELEDVKISNSESLVRVSYRPRWGSHSSGEFVVNVPSQCKLDMKTSGGDIEVNGTVTGDVYGTTSGGDIKLEKAVGKVEMKTSGGDIVVGDIEGATQLNTSGGDIRLGNVGGEAEVSTSGGDIRIKSVSKKVSARTSGGDIEVGDVGGDAQVSTAGGDIRVGKVSGNATLKTAGGDVELSGGSGKVQAKTAGGDVTLQNITGSISAATAGGDVKAELIPSGKGSSDLKTAGGDIDLRIPESAKVTIEATIHIRDSWGGFKKKKNYKVTSDFKADTYDDKEEDEIRARYVLNGGGELIELETSNGNITIRKK